MGLGGDVYGGWRLKEGRTGGFAGVSRTAVIAYHNLSPSRCLSSPPSFGRSSNHLPLPSETLLNPNPPDNLRALASKRCAPLMHEIPTSNPGGKFATFSQSLPRAFNNSRISTKPLTFPAHLARTR